jgi:predicted nucleic acid-binding protein
MLAWWTTRTEIISALTRSVREKRITAHQAETILEEVNRILDKATIIQPGPLIQEEAQRLLFVHPLRASDALQLAAIVVTEGTPDGFSFVTLDHRLRAAAAMEGFTVQPA